MRALEMTNTSFTDEDQYRLARVFFPTTSSTLDYARFMEKMFEQDKEWVANRSALGPLPGHGTRGGGARRGGGAQQAWGVTGVGVGGRPPSGRGAARRSAW